MEEPKCGNCEFFKPLDGRADGFCRRYPPQVQSLDSRWPLTGPLEWCGDYKPDAR